MDVAPVESVVVQLSDPHIGSRLAGRGRTAGDALRRAVDAVGALRVPVDLVLVSGDLVDRGRDAEYAELFAILDELPGPFAVMAGNHDDPGRLRALVAARGRPPLADLPGVCFAVDAGPVRVVALDSCVPGADAGRLGPEQCAWLDRELAGDRRPTVVALHHPPVPIGHALLDTMYLADAGALGAVVERHPHVERIVCGHAHRAVTVRWCGTVVSVAPSSIRQFAPALDPHVPFAATGEQAAMAVHVWVGGALATHVVGFA